MLEDLKAIEDRAGLLVNWVAEMKTLIQNPYTNGLNVPKILDDLSGFSADLVKSIVMLEDKIKQENPTPEEESEKVESASVE